MCPRVQYAPPSLSLFPSSLAQVRYRLEYLTAVFVSPRLREAFARPEYASATASLFGISLAMLRAKL